MSYCEKCGRLLTEKRCGTDGLVPYCETCGEFRFPWFSSAVSAVVVDPTRRKILLIQQYGKKDNVLVAGYINKGENAKQTLLREVWEETGLKVSEFYYNDDEYFNSTNTLMHNFVAVVEDDKFTLTDEVDYAAWYPIDEALEKIKPKSLAQKFLRKAVRDIIAKW